MKIPREIFELIKQIKDMMNPYKNEYFGLLAMALLYAHDENFKALIDSVGVIHSLPDMPKCLMKCSEYSIARGIIKAFTLLKENKPNNHLIIRQCKDIFKTNFVNYILAESRDNLLEKIFQCNVATTPAVSTGNPCEDEMNREVAIVNAVLNSVHYKEVKTECFVEYIYYLYNSYNLPNYPFGTLLYGLGLADEKFVGVNLIR